MQSRPVFAMHHTQCQLTSSTVPLRTSITSSSTFHEQYFHDYSRSVGSHTLLSRPRCTMTLHYTAYSHWLSTTNNPFQDVQQGKEQHGFAMLPSGWDRSSNFASSYGTKSSGPLVRPLHCILDHCALLLQRLGHGGPRLKEGFDDVLICQGAEVSEIAVIPGNLT